MGINNFMIYSDKTYIKLIFNQYYLVHIDANGFARKNKEENIMSTVSQIESKAIQSSMETKETQKKSKVTGKTIGKPELSEKAQKYYEELKNKYSNMDFILVSTEMKEVAKAQAGSYANANKMVVLIDEEKIERMAVDEEYRKQYEQIISNAANELPTLQSQLSTTSADIKGFGMQVNDNGTASYFAVVDKSLAKQQERIEKKAEEKREAKKVEAKKDAKERLEELRQGSKDKINNDSDLVTVTASSIEELIFKINDLTFSWKSDSVQTDAEKLVGSHIDYRG